MAMRGGIIARGEAKESFITAQVIRKDGTIEDRGVVSYWNKNWAKHYAVNAWILMKDAWRGIKGRVRS